LKPFLTFRYRVFWIASPTLGLARFLSRSVRQPHPPVPLCPAPAWGTANPHHAPRLTPGGQIFFFLRLTSSGFCFIPDVFFCCVFSETPFPLFCVIVSPRHSMNFSFPQTQPTTAFCFFLNRHPGGPPALQRVRPPPCPKLLPQVLGVGIPSSAFDSLTRFYPDPGSQTSPFKPVFSLIFVLPLFFS